MLTVIKNGDVIVPRKRTRDTIGQFGFIEDKLIVLPSVAKRL